jgi:hypothetical protein
MLGYCKLFKIKINPEEDCYYCNKYEAGDECQYYTEMWDCKNGGVNYERI